MTPEQQRSAIAEACGWVKDSHNGYQPTWKSPSGKRWAESNLPDYLNDLNAMHDAVMSLPPGTRLLFRKELQYMIAPRTRPGPVSGLVVMCAESYDEWFHSTAAQRAEAFLRALGKWEGGAV